MRLRDASLALTILSLLLSCGKSDEPVTVGSPGSAATAAPHASPAQPQKLALLIGIDRYKHESDRLRALHGCKNDVHIMQELLRTRFEFPAAAIKTLVDDEATREQIICQFEEHLINQVNEDAVVVFYFSGHGSQVRDTTSDEVDGKDETIVAYDSHVKDDDTDVTTGDLVDDKLYGLINRLMDKTRHVTYIFDSCHSGSMTKGLGSSRRADRILENVQPQPTAVDDSTTVANYALITGCTSEQRSWEYTPSTGIESGKTFGTLTYFLVREIESHLNDKVTYADIMDSVILNVSAAKPQTPELKGAQANSIVFGVESIATQPHIVVSTDNDKVLVPRGRSTGLTVGSILDVYSPTTKRFDDEDARMSRIELTKVDDYSSEAKYLQGDPVPNASRAVIRMVKQEQRTGVYLDVNGTSHDNSAPDEATLNALKHAMVAHEDLGPTLRFVENEAQATLVLTVFQNDTVAICYRGAALSATVKKTDPDRDPRVIAQVMHWGKWTNLLLIGNGNSGLNVAFNISGSRRVDENGLHEFQDGDEITFEVQNNETDRNVYFAIINLRANGHVKVIYPGRTSLQEIQADALEPRTAWRRKSTARIPTGAMDSTDQLKLLVFDRKVDVGFLEMAGAPRSLDAGKSDFHASFPLAAAAFQSKDIEPITSPDSWSSRLLTTHTVP